MIYADSWVVIAAARLLVLLSCAWCAVWLCRSQNPRWRVWIWRTASVGAIGTLCLSTQPSPIRIEVPAVTVQRNISTQEEPNRTPKRLEPGDVVPSLAIRNEAQLNHSDAQLQSSVVSSSLQIEQSPSLDRSTNQNAMPSLDAEPASSAVPPRNAFLLSEFLALWSEPLLVLLWVLGVVLLLARLVVSWRSCCSQIRKSSPAAPAIQTLANELAGRLGCRPVPVVCNAEVGSPALIGVIQPRIVLPARMALVSSDDELHAALAHELSHYFHRDLFWHNVLELLRVLLWPVPAAWGMPNSHRYACELLSDETAASLVSNRESYRNSLARIALRVFTRATPLSISMVATPEIHRRLQLLKAIPLSRPAAWKLRAAAGVACALVLGICSIGVSRPSVASQLTEQPPAEQKTKPIDKEPAAENAPSEKQTTPIASTPNRIFRGRVYDEQGEPIAGATIRIFKAFDPFPARAVREITKTTDSNGIWEWDLGELPTVVALRVTHPNYIQRELPLTKFSGEPLDSQLKAAKSIRGRIVDESKKPVENATIHVVSSGMSDGMVFQDRSNAVSQPDGTFTVSGIQGTAAELHAIAPNGYTAYMVNTAVEPEKPYELVATPPNPLDFQIRNTRGEPVVEAKIALREWAGSRHIRWNSETDSSGNVTWPIAPKGKLVFTVDHPDYSTKWHVIEPPFQPVQQISLDAPLKIDAKVVDSTTNEPIERFKAVIRYKRLVDELGPRESFPDAANNANYSQFNRPVTLEGTNGDLAFANDLDFVEFEMDVTAQGYLPIQVKIAKTDKTIPTEFRLQPAAIANFTVLCPDGSPATGACVSITKENAFIKFSEEDFEKSLQAQSPYDMTVRLRTDGKGQFEPTWSKDDFALMIHHPSGYFIGPAGRARSMKSIQLLPWVTVRFSGLKAEALQSETLELQYHYFPMSRFYFQVPVKFDPATEEAIAIEAPSGFYGTLANIVMNGNSGVHYRLVNFLSDSESEQTHEHVIAMSGNASVRGKLTFSGPKIPGTPQLQIHSVSGAVQLSRLIDVQSDGSFEFRDLPAGQYAFENQMSEKQNLFERNEIRPKSSRYYVLNDPDVGFTIKEDESLDIGTVTYERKVIDANPVPTKFEPKYVAATDSFESSNPVRFVVRTGRPLWQRFGTSHTEKVQLLDTNLQILREFGFETTQGVFGRNRRSNDGSMFVLAYNNELAFFDPFGKQTGKLQNAMPPSMAGTIFQNLMLVGPRSLNKGPAELSLFDHNEHVVKPFSGARMSMVADSPMETGVWGYTGGVISKFALSGKELYTVKIDDAKLQPRELCTDVQTGGCWLTLYNPEAWGESMGWVVRVVDGKTPIVTELGQLLPMHTEVLDGDAYILGFIDQSPFSSSRDLEIVRVDTSGVVKGRWPVNCRDMCLDPEGRGIWLALADQLALVAFEGDAMRVIETRDVPGVHGLLVLPKEVNATR